MDYLEWIKNDLIKNLIENRKFTLPWEENDLPKIVDLDLKPMTTSDAFMLTSCFKIKIILSDASGEQTAEFGIIVKVTTIFIVLYIFIKQERIWTKFLEEVFFLNLYVFITRE